MKLSKPSRCRVTLLVLLFGVMCWASLSGMAQKPLFKSTYRGADDSTSVNRVVEPLTDAGMLGSNRSSSPLPANVRRVVVLGNSITYAGTYVTFIDAYFRLQYPNQPVEFINLGLPSETVSGLSETGHADGKFPRPDLHERLSRLLTLTKPDLVIACYGMNDGIYLPLDKDRFQKFKDGMAWLHDEVRKAGASIIHVTPPIYDELKGKKTGYAAVLDTYSDWLLSQQKDQKWAVIDIHYPMKQYLEAHRQVDARLGIAGFALAEDGVHPGEVGHWIMAKNILTGLGINELATATSFTSATANKPNVSQVLKGVAERQSLLKDAWLTAVGHKRPGMKAGLSLAEAQAKAAEIGQQIQQINR